MDYTQIIVLALESLTAASKLIGEIKAQSGMTDEQLLEIAASNGAETHATIKKLLAEAKAS